MSWNKKQLLKCIILPLVVGGIAGAMTSGSMKEFEALNQPPLSPPGWIFPVVWTILYLLMGISSYLISTSEQDWNEVKRLMDIYRFQLLVNFLWPIFFFNFGWYLFAIIWLLLLWVLVIVMIIRFWNINKLAAYLNIPYILWLTFAAVLNFAIWILNR